MKNKPIIGIVARPNKLANNKIFLGSYENYIKKIVLNGGIPFIITSTQTNFLKELTEQEKQDLTSILDLCDGIIMPGGEDPYPYDFFINDYALKNDIPVLGICLGMQVMGLADQGDLIQVSNHYLTNHDIYLKENTKINNIYNKKMIIVNSRHHYKLTKVNNYIVSGISMDGVIEAIERNDKKFNIGVEWHPEDLSNNDLFRTFINCCISK